MKFRGLSPLVGIFSFAIRLGLIVTNLVGFLHHIILDTLGIFNNFRSAFLILKIVSQSLFCFLFGKMLFLLL
jgi:hypothetical protein